MPSAPHSIIDTAPPEVQTVVSAVRAVVAGESMTPPLTDLDWDRIHEIARRHQVIPLVCEGIANADVESSVKDTFERDRRTILRHNLGLVNELRAVLTLLEDEGIRALPYKGPVLADVGYGELYRRSFGDIDILVSPDDAVTACRILQSNGYAPDDSITQLLQFGYEVPVFHRFHECAFRSSSENKVEIRWRLGPSSDPVDVSFESLWQRRTTTTIGGREVPALSSEDRVLILSAHGTGHAWRRLEWIADVTASMRSDREIEWDVLLDRARAWNVEIPLYTAVLLAATVFGISLPDEVERRATTSFRARLLARWALDRFAARPSSIPRIPEEFLYTTLAIDEIHTIPSKTVSQVGRPYWSEYQRHPLPQVLWPLYVFPHLLRVPKRILRRLLTPPKENRTE